MSNISVTVRLILVVFPSLLQYSAQSGSPRRGVGDDFKKGDIVYTHTLYVLRVGVKALTNIHPLLFMDVPYKEREGG